MLRAERFFEHRAAPAREGWASCDQRQDGRASFWRRKLIEWEPWRHARERIRQRLRPARSSTVGSGFAQETHFRSGDTERKEGAMAPQRHQALPVGESEASPARCLGLFLGPSRKWRQRNASCRDRFLRSIWA